MFVIIYVGHKYYGIVRRRLFVDSIDNIVYKHDYNNYKSKILAIIKEKNINKFAYEIFLRENIICSIIAESAIQSVYFPLLWFVGDGYSKIFYLLLETLFHFNNCILNKSQNLTMSNEEDNATTFLETYLNFNSLKNGLVSSLTFVKLKVHICICDIYLNL